MERIPFTEAIEDEGLLKDHFDGLTMPCQVALKAFYGCELDGRNVNPETGWSELDYWAIVQGSCEYDDLGFVTKVKPIPYQPEEYYQFWGVIGRRAGKTSQLQSTIIAYEAALGGHEEYVGRKQDCLIYLVAHRLGLAQSNLMFVRGILDSSPILAKQINNHISDRISLKNGISIVPSPPNLKAQRGLACPVVAMDEVGFWYTDSESANPDFEVERAVTWSQLQFPYKKRIGISTPWVKEGLLWKYHKAGTSGKNLDVDKRGEYEGILSVFGTSASFESPLITREALTIEKRADSDGFDRESLCLFSDSISGFLGRALIEKATDKAKDIAERPPITEDAELKDKGGFVPYYVAAMDPAFRTDSFGFSIVHKHPTRGIVVDVLRRWTPIKGQKLNPKEVLAEIWPLVKQYSVDTVYTDQYQLESLQQLALDIGIMVEGVDFTSKSKAKIFGNLQQLFNQQKIELLDPDLSAVAKTLVDELVILELRRTQQGAVQISAPEGKHDDMAAVLALSSYKAMWMDGLVINPPIAEELKVKEPTLFERGIATIQQKQRASIETDGY